MITRSPPNSSLGEAGEGAEVKRRFAWHGSCGGSCSRRQQREVDPEHWEKASEYDSQDGKERARFGGPSPCALTTGDFRRGRRAQYRRGQVFGACGMHCIMFPLLRAIPDGLCPANSSASLPQCPCAPLSRPLSALTCCFRRPVTLCGRPCAAAVATVARQGLYNPAPTHRPAMPGPDLIRLPAGVNAAPRPVPRPGRGRQRLHRLR